MVVSDAPIALVWVRKGNCSNEALMTWLERRFILRLCLIFRCGQDMSALTIGHADPGRLNAYQVGDSARASRV